MKEICSPLFLWIAHHICHDLNKKRTGKPTICMQIQLSHKRVFSLLESGLNWSYWIYLEILALWLYPLVYKFLGNRKKLNSQHNITYMYCYLLCTIIIIILQSISILAFVTHSYLLTSSLHLSSTVLQNQTITWVPLTQVCRKRLVLIVITGATFLPGDLLQSQGKIPGWFSADWWSPLFHISAIKR